jgi:D-alanine--poly(phosphoribitol) ligase subunit 1
VCSSDLFVVLAGPLAGSEFATTQELKRGLAQYLPAYMLPRRFVYLAAMPLTANGKTDRRKLAERLA